MKVQEGRRRRRHTNNAKFSSPAKAAKKLSTFHASFAQKCLKKGRFWAIFCKFSLSPPADGSEKNTIFVPLSKIWSREAPGTVRYISSISKGEAGFGTSGGDACGIPMHTYDVYVSAI